MAEEIEIQQPDTSPAAGSQAGRPINIEPDQDTISVDARVYLASFTLPADLVDEEEVKLIEAQIGTALLRYQKGTLKTMPSGGNNFRFYSYLAGGAVGIGAGSLTLGVGEKPGTGRTVLGALAIAFGTLSLTGAVMNFPKNTKTVCYNVEFRTVDRQAVMVRIILPLGLSDIEFVEQSEKQIKQGLDRFVKSTKPNPAKESFDKDAKDDTIGKMDPNAVLSDPLAEYGDAPQEQADDDLAPTSPSSPPPAAPSADSSSSSSSADPAPVKARTDDQSAIDAKYGSVVKTPQKNPGIGEHGSYF